MCGSRPAKKGNPLTASWQTGSSCCSFWRQGAPRGRARGRTRVRGGKCGEPGVRRRHGRRGPAAAQRVLQQRVVRAVQRRRRLHARVALSAGSSTHPSIQWGPGHRNSRPARSLTRRPAPRHLLAHAAPGGWETGHGTGDQGRRQRVLQQRVVCAVQRDRRLRAGGALGAGAGLQ